MANTKVTSRVLANDAVLTANIADDQVTTAKIADDVALGGNPTTTTQSAGNNTTRIATTAFVTTAVANIVDSAPSALDTLNELAAALGDDANFSTTITNSIATKLPLAGGTLTGGLTGTSATFTDDVAINNSSPELYFGTTGNHYNWRIAAQENVDAALTIDVGSQDTAYGDDTYSSVFTVKNTGNVGIGISPTKKLTVYGTGAGEATVQIEGEGGADPYINFLANNTQHWSLGIDDSDSDKFKLSKHSALGTNDYFTVNTSGNVGIGESNPDYLLDMRGAIGDQAPLQRWTVTGTPSAGFNWVTEAMSTNLGQDKRIVHAFGKERSNGNSGTMSFVPRASSGDNAIAFGIFGNNDILNITYNGHVGIGTTTPARKLTVKSGGANATQISLVDNDSTNEVFAVGQQSDGDGFLALRQDDGTTKVLFDGSGDSYIAGGSLHIGSTDSISSSSEIFSVYSASTGHTKLVNNSDSYGTVYMHNESTTANTFQPSIIIQKGGGNRGNIGVRHSDSVLGIQGQGGISLRTGSTSLQASSERLNIGSDGFVKFAGGNGFGSLHNTGQNVTSTFANYFDFSDLAAGSGEERGMYLVALSRNGGSVGSRLLAFIGISTNQTVYVYEILASAVLSIQGSGSNLQVKHLTTGTQSVQGTAIPVAIDHN